MNRLHTHSPLRPVAVGALLLATLVAPFGMVQANEAAAPPTILASDIAPFDIVYDVGNNLITAGLASLTFNQQDGNWVYTLATKPTGVFKLTGKGRIREVSVLEIAQTGEVVDLMPQSYSYRQDDEARRSVDASFDWAGGTLDWTSRGKSGTAALNGPVLDRLSVTLAVMHWLRQGFDEIEFEIFDNGEMKTMRFVNEGEETLDTPMGDVPTIKVRGENADGGSRSSMTWFAPSLDFVPVRMEQRKRGELVARMNLMKLKNRLTELEVSAEK